jgi:hypothetical protein
MASSFGTPTSTLALPGVALLQSQNASQGACQFVNPKITGCFKKISCGGATRANQPKCDIPHKQH